MEFLAQYRHPGEGAGDFERMNALPDGSWHPYDQDDPLEILSRISPTDIAQIVFRLLRFSENRRLHITGLNAS